MPTLTAMLTRCLVIAGIILAAPVSAQDIDFTSFHTPTQIDDEMARLTERFPSLVQLATIGTSLEGRDIKAISIRTSEVANNLKGDVVFVALHHAREWISVEMALALAEHLCKQYGNDSQMTADIDHLRIWIIPVMNPDGYAFTNDSDRMWRKNRRPNDDGSFGVDLNRNYSFQWGLSPGSSSDPFIDTYSGPSPFSEPETQVIRDFVGNLANLKAFVSYHSFSELFLRSWSYTTDDPPGEPSLKSIALRNIDAIGAVHGETYGQTLYLMAGEATDYLWSEHRVAAFTTELRPTAEAGVDGFTPPPSAIIPSNEENFPSAAALLHDAGAREVWIRDYEADVGIEPSATWNGTSWSQAFWRSPDIWTTEETLVGGTTVTLNVRVHNNTGATVPDVTVEAYFTDPRISLEFPSLESTLIGSKTVDVPADGRTVQFAWTVPLVANSWGEFHWCVGAIVKEAHDMPLTTVVPRTSNVAIRNFETAPARIRGRPLRIGATNFLQTDAELIVQVDTSSLPRGWKVRVVEVPKKYPSFKVPIPRSDLPLTSIERKARLLGTTGFLLRPRQTVTLSVQVDPPPGAPRGASADVNIAGALMPLTAGKRPVMGNGYTFRVVVGPTANR